MTLADLTEEKIAEIAKEFAAGGTVREQRGISNEEMDAIYATGLGFYKTGNLENAEKIFKFLVLFDHTSSRYWTAMGALRQVQKRYDEALSYYQYACFFDIRSPKPYYYAAECYLAKGDKAACLASLDQLAQYAGEGEKGRVYLAKAVKLRAIAQA